eukprot:12868810-Prorocentrum_lima.AAC.1
MMCFDASNWAVTAAPLTLWSHASKFSRTETIKKVSSLPVSGMMTSAAAIYVAAPAFPGKG